MHHPKHIPESRSPESRSPESRSPEPQVPASNRPVFGPAPTRTLRAVRALRVTGRGRVVIHLTGTGHLNLQRGRFDDFCFEGRGTPKHLSAQQVHLDRAEGTVILEGSQLVVEFSGGAADVELTGTFDTETRGSDDGPSQGDRKSRRAA